MRAAAPSRVLSLRPLSRVSTRALSAMPYDAVAARRDNDTALDVSYNGRQSNSGVTATVFGANGFIGRYVVNRLGRIGSQVVVPYRGDGMNIRHLKIMGDLGQMVFRPIELTDPDSIRTSVERSNVVINLIGAAHETKNYSYDDVNVKVIHRIAKIAAETGRVKRFIHVSAAGADKDSPSEFLKSKAHGEEVVKDYFPKATIIRPCHIFGDEDQFLNKIADAVNFFPFVPQVGDGDGLVQPIYVQDVAQCIVNAMVNTDAPGKTYTLGGPDKYTQNQILEFVTHQINREASCGVPLPDLAVSVLGKALTMVPKSWRLVHPDEVAQAYCDMTVPKYALGCEELGLKPTTLAKDGPFGLIRHRGERDPHHGKFELPRGMGKIDAF